MEGIGRLVGHLVSPFSHQRSEGTVLSEGSEVNIVVSGKVIASATVLNIGGPFHNREIGSDFAVLHSLHILDMQAAQLQKAWKSDTDVVKEGITPLADIGMVFFAAPLDVLQPKRN